MKPTVLVATTSRWFPTARLAVALAQAGFTVDAVCPPRHPLGKTRAVAQICPYRGLAPLRSFVEAIAEKTRPHTSRGRPRHPAPAPLMPPGTPSGENGISDLPTDRA